MSLLEERIKRASKRPSQQKKIDPPQREHVPSPEKVVEQQEQIEEDEMMEEEEDNIPHIQVS